MELPRDLMQEFLDLALYAPDSTAIDDEELEPIERDDLPHLAGVGSPGGVVLSTHGARQKAVV